MGIYTNRGYNKYKLNYETKRKSLHNIYKRTY